VLLVDKEAFLGGNSAWASSGVNAVLPDVTDDSVALYRLDTLKVSLLALETCFTTLVGLIDCARSM
jgi:succinate dehydrogenase/fumarate reductase flavoprotein subunit